MARIGKFKSDEAREAYLRTYEAMAELWPVPAELADVPTSFGPTHVRRSGSGDGVPLVLLAGVLGSSLHWHAVVEGLAQGRTVHAFDTIGAAGRSVQTAPLAGDADYGVWFAEVLDGLGLDRVHVLGESSGAWHATLAGLYAADRVASVTLIEPNGVITRIPWRALLKVVRFGGDTTDEGWRRMGEWLTPGVTMTDVERATAKASQRYRLAAGWARPLKDAELESFAPPLLAIYGGESVVSEPAAGKRRLAERLPSAEVEIYPGGHGVRGQVPDQVTARVVDFLARHDPAVRPGR
ncbi:Pimeloyl-ACP methyl ester carboxylesterase [Promicromonospora umidemergens]|uniref:Alpha/beta hydrolase n=1 Tax=Promicromonospora umidemergens TaxID=629679 RepID=A0ABP8X4U5_9MICO|nr:alpha/beta fold hydrolase [Promicromonospora umidemergens]MCP2281209.1 Pimeloyl-ACP methyl ester carboxylesterase [Promicromonospora umidemergens]